MIRVIGYERSSDTLQGHSPVDMCCSVGARLAPRAFASKSSFRSGPLGCQTRSEKIISSISSAKPNIETSRGMIRSSCDLLF